MKATMTICKCGRTLEMFTPDLDWCPSCKTTQNGASHKLKGLDLVGDYDEQWIRHTFGDEECGPAIRYGDSGVEELSIDFENWVPIRGPKKTDFITAYTLASVIYER
jgi:hypothetical protein